MIRVYLDSSDYSVMSDSRKEWAQNIRSFLSDQVDAGIIEIRFSGLHPLEGAHIEEDAKPMAVRRAELMAELSGHKCFAWWWDGLLLEETSRLAMGERLIPEEYALRDDGRWFPPLNGIAAEMKDIFRRTLKESVAELKLPRAQRRQVIKQIWNKGRLTQQAIDFLRPGRQQLLEELKERFPLPQRFFDEDMMFRFATGQLPARAIVDALEEAFRDLPVYVGWVYDRHDPERKSTRWLRSGDLTEAIYKLRSQVAELVELGRPIGKGEKDVNAIIRKTRLKLLETRVRILWHIFDDVKAKLAPQRIDKQVWQTRVIDTPLGTIPSLDSILEVGIEYFLRNTMAGTNHRKLLISDYGDILHMGYLPYADVFRCDSHAAEFARKTAAAVGTEVVSKLTLLPDAIKRLTQATR